MLVFDGLHGTFRNIKLRPKQKNCVVCGDNPTLKRLIDYEEFCGSPATDKDHSVHLLNEDERVTCKVNILISNLFSDGLSDISTYEKLLVSTDVQVNDR